jgi:ABC-type multidrug transport system fused ATPase/permease subunit
MPPRAEKERPSLSVVWREAKEIIWRYRRRIVLGLVVMIVSRLAGLVAPASSKFLIDNVIAEGQTEMLPILAFAVGVAALIQGVSSFALSQILGVTAQRAITEMRKTVQSHVTRLPVSFFDSTKSGVLISRIMTDAQGIRNLVGTGLVQLVGGLFTAVIALAVLLYLNWALTLYTLTVLAVFGGAMSYAFSRLRPLFRERGRINAEVTGRLGESLGGVRIVKAFTSERRENRVFAKGAHSLFRNVATAVTGVSGVTSFTSVVTGLIGVGMILVGGNAILDGRMTLGDFVMYLFFTGLMINPLVQMANIGTQITEAFAGLDRIREIRAVLTEEDADANLEPLGDFDATVSFEDVRFSYEKGVPVLKGVSFEAPAGTTTALVGSSGSGKSTIIGLVLAYMRPDSGTIRIGDRDLSAVRVSDYRQHVGVVLQDNFLFDDTVLENIRYGTRDASTDEVQEAARIAHCDQFISGFPHGYDTIIGERGVKLSGGQRQRIAIARAVLADPRILVLDEATSSLDSESEAMIQDGLRALMRGRTTFVIAHRLSTIQNADQILVIEDGRVAERGTHADLLALGGRYRELYDRQYRLERNRFINPGEDFTEEPARSGG